MITNDCQMRIYFHGELSFISQDRTCKSLLIQTFSSFFDFDLRTSNELHRGGYEMQGAYDD